MPVSHAALYSFFRQLLPDEPNDLIYHSPLPRHRHYDPSKTRFTVDRVILSLTPTQGVYAALQRPSENKKRSALFLHRPFTLDRRRVPHGTLVLQSHVKFDELYTTGYNTAFFAEHGGGGKEGEGCLHRSRVPDGKAKTSSETSQLDHDQSDGRTAADEGGTVVCIKGYNGNPERKIGLVGRLSQPMPILNYIERISEAFGGHELIRLHNGSSTETGQEGEDPDPDPAVDLTPEIHTTIETNSLPTPTQTIELLVSMNAFTPEIVDRIWDAIQASFPSIPAPKVLCVTGAVRESGIARASEIGFNVVAVGHKRCEDWGVKYFQRRLVDEFGSTDLEVEWVDEPEEREQKRPQKVIGRDGGREAWSAYSSTARTV